MKLIDELFRRVAPAKSEAHKQKPPLEPISLGPSCASKFQLARSLYQRTHPRGSVEDLRAAIHSRRASAVFPRHLFDAQITPLKGLLAYLEQDFAGVFERDDLFVGRFGMVEHRHLGTMHPHEFHPVEGVLDAAVIDAQYPAARAKFDRLAQRFRDHLNAPGPFLYVRGEAFRPDDVTVTDEALSPQDAARLIALLSARGPHHRFQLLVADTQAGPDLSPVDARIRQGVVPAHNDKAAQDQWEGDDAGWESVLKRFDLGLPRGPAYTAHFNIVQDFAGLDLQPMALGWRTIPGFAAAPPLPHTFPIGGDAWAYAGLSDAVEGYAAERPRTLVATVEVLSGDVGLTMTRPDGSGLVGPEYWVRPEDGRLDLSLALSPGMGPSNILLRRHGEAGEPGAVRVHGVRISA